MFASLCGDAVKSLRHSRFVLGGNVVLVVLNVVLNVALITRFGITGAAVASAVSTTVGNSLYVFKLYAKTGIHSVFPAFPRVLISAGAALVPLLAVQRFADAQIWILPVLAVLYLLVYLVTLTVVGGLRDPDVEVLDAVEENAGIELLRVRAALHRYV